MASTSSRRTAGSRRSSRSVAQGDLHPGHERQLLDDGLLAPFHRRGRIVPPSSAEWRRISALLARLGAAGSKASWQNDVLLAVQAREYGWTVVTRDQDLTQLRPKVSGLRVSAPYPERS